MKEEIFTRLVLCVAVAALEMTKPFISAMSIGTLRIGCAFGAQLFS